MKFSQEVRFKSILPPLTQVGQLSSVSPLWARPQGRSSNLAARPITEKVAFGRAPHLMPPARKFLIVDDDRHAEANIIEALEPVGRVHFARSRDKATKAARQRWLGAMVSLSFPHGSPITLARRILHDQSTVSLVLLTNAKNSPVNDDSLQRHLPGTVSVLQKPLSERDLCTFAIRAVAAAWTHEKRLTELVVHYATQSGLIPREAEIVAAAMAGVSRAELATSLQISENTLKGPIRVLLAKCGAPSVESLVNDILRGALG